MLGKRRTMRLVIATTIIMLGSCFLFYSQTTNGDLSFERFKANLPKFYGGEPKSDEQINKEKTQGNADENTNKEKPAEVGTGSKESETEPEPADPTFGSDSKSKVSPPVDDTKPIAPGTKETGSASDNKKDDEAGDSERNSFLSSFLTKMQTLSPPKDLTVLKAKSGLPEELSDAKLSKTAVTAKNLAKYLDVPEDHVATLKKLHSEFVQALPQIPANFYKKGRSVVLTGGGAYMAPMLSAVIWLRNHKVDAPIEVFMSKKEYVPELCNKVLPSYHAECRLVEDIYGEQSLQRFKYMGYPLKVLALIASRYEETYFMDADSLPLSKIDDLFEQEVYKKFEYVMWPDFWARSTIPEFYDIVGKPITLPHGADPELLPVHDYEGAIPEAQSAESGQLLVNKSKHFRSLLLNLYYNINGFEQYYPLLTAGAPGEGDKDCFAASAFVMDEKLYQVEKRPGVLGYWQEKDFNGRAIIQYDPQDDYELFKAEKKANDPQQKLKAAVLHANGIKLNPLSLYCNSEDKVCSKRPAYRIFGPPKDTANSLGKDSNYDVELELFSCLNVAVCTHIASASAEVYQGFEGYDLAQLCKQSTEHIEWLTANTA